LIITHQFKITARECCTVLSLKLFVVVKYKNSTLPSSYPLFKKWVHNRDKRGAACSTSPSLPSPDSKIVLFAFAKEKISPTLKSHVTEKLAKLAVNLKITDCLGSVISMLSFL
jgi:hypothetical protein